MQKVTIIEGIAAPLDAANVDTDQIMPKQFLKRTERDGFGQFLFNDWRFLADGSPNPEFVLNQPRYAGAAVLVARENFGGGSSREHAPWALQDYGFQAVIAPSFADIFRNNCLSIGLLTVELSAGQVDDLMARIAAQEGYTVRVDLPAQTVAGADGFAANFDIDPHRKRRLVEGLDNIGLTLTQEAAIAAYEQAHNAPWQAAARRAAGQGE